MKIVGITGSLRRASCNTGLLRSVNKLFVGSSHSFELIVPDQLPLYNEDIDGKQVPEAATKFRSQIQNADAFIVAAPEYNFSVSGALKNAIDWASRGPNGNVWNGKPAAVFSAGGGVGGWRAQNNFREMALGVNLQVMNHPQLFLRIFENKLFDRATGDLTDAASEEQVKKFFDSFVQWSNQVIAMKKA
jgi:chromate reductase, NAD(P)H dehydrogenase (quinone)